MRFLVAIDGTSTSENTFNFLLSIVKPEDEILLLAVAEDTATYIAGPFDPVNFTAVNQINSAITESMKNVLREHGKVLAAQKLHFKCLLGKGPAKETICEEAENRKVDIILIGRSESKGLRRVTHEAHSTYVYNNAKCSVIIVKETIAQSSPPKPQAAGRKRANTLDF